MQTLLADGMDACIDLLRASPDKAQNLFNDLLIGVTELFRDGKERELLAQNAIPRPFRDKPQRPPGSAPARAGRPQAPGPSARRPLRAG